MRRELLRAGLLRSVRRLDDLKQTIQYDPLSTDTMLLAAHLTRFIAASDWQEID